MTTPLLQQIEKLSEATARKDVAQAARDMAAYDLRELLVKRLPQITQALRVQEAAATMYKFRDVPRSIDGSYIVRGEDMNALSALLQSSPEGGG